MTMNNETRNKILSFQKSEMTEYFIYTKLALIEKNTNNKEILEKVALDELRHYNIWKKYTQEDVRPDRFKIWEYTLIARFFGLTFGLKLMENGEVSAQEVYGNMTSSVAEATGIAEEEDAHEHQLLDMIDEEKLKYVGSIVLGLNDALVELTGALAGLTFALANARLVAIAGVITGIAGAMSMSASAYLSAKSESGGKNPAKASIYTGITYISTVTVLVLPYLLLNNLLLSLGIMLVSTVAIILIFTFYVSVAKNLDFRKRFLEMVSISLGVAALSFIIGFGVRGLLHIE
ncbi:MAG: VIT1/CCC1 transporter family protein [Candidatus Omnitrophota bacterium]|jgi:VIT1/CCC1 family predicted Fe2+/Mn2+ transporter